ncbi:ABC transporter permease [Sphaerimonospora thailandensis]|uniref:ABC transporter permease n=1 Tax=Sphaerimonospora thailandensis TaxID=795644 RepID=A0A8J3RDS6_9ACTN|nr:ABC transporter permease [Sphaerimonospora thailandensis]GIH72411.1 ABC transporter permease [Sphaerimonospora thailandensis]
MTALVTRRLLTSLPMLFLVTLMAFSLSYLLPGDTATAIAGEGANAERVEAIRQQIGLDQGFVSRYVSWLGGLLTGDLGTSWVTGQSVSSELLRRLPVTASIAAGTLLIAVLLGVPIGLLQGMRARRSFDRAALLATAVGLAIPNFWLATILTGTFSVQLGWLPALGYTPISSGVVPWMKHLVLPCLTLGVFAAAEMARQVRTSYLHVQEQPYIQTAIAKGIPARSLVGKHIMKNAAAPAITVLGIRLSHLISGTVIVEEIFGAPGIGKFAIESIRSHDFPSIQVLILFSAMFVVIINMAIDVVYCFLNPKVRLS